VPRIVRTPEPTLPEIAGVVPPPGALPRGCAFAPRCAIADAACHQTRPVLAPHGAAREVACWKPADG
jgi:oligopeptide/dipeptide ABC transporter ATP-binding protein